MLELITQRLQGLQQSGQWDKTMGEFKQRVIENSQRPAPVEGLHRAEKYAQRWFDPSIRLTEDLKDNEGRVFAHQGELINPLKTVPFMQTLYFINGDDPDQIAWMKRQVPETLMSKIIWSGAASLTPRPRWTAGFILTRTVCFQNGSA
jgi:conjugal transfer pilus assembly protein TraW